jgi:MFS family permease
MSKMNLKQPNATLAALCLTELLSWATLYYIFSIFVAPMQAELGWTQPELMGALSFGLFCMGLSALPAGMCIDRFGGRWVMSLGSLLGVLGLVAWSQVQTLAYFYLLWGVIGVAFSMVLYEPAFAVVTRAFGTDYRRAITYLTLTGGFASTLSFPLCYWLIAQVGWREALLWLALINALVCLPLHWFVLRTTPNVNWAHAKPDDGEIDIAVPRPIVSPAVRPTALKAALKSGMFWTLAIAFTLYTMVVTALWMHMMPMLADKGYTPGEAVAVIAWIGPMQVAGRFVQFLFGSHLGAAKLGKAVFFGLPLAVVTLAFAPKAFAAMFLFAFLFGAGNGVVTIVRGAVVPEFIGRKSVGAVNGAMAMPAAFARAAAPFLASLLLSGLGNYRNVLAVLMAIALLALASFWAATVLAVRHSAGAN